MKRVRIRSAEDIDNLPEGEWVEVVGGLNAKFTYPPIRVENGDLVVDLPKDVQHRFGKGRGDELRARISKGSLIVTRRPAGKPKRRT
jgi:hypothetical protein